MLDYYRFGTCAGMDAPGGNVLLGLMGNLRQSAGTPPEQLLLVKGRMGGGQCSPSRVSACELLVHVLEGSVLVRSGLEEVRLITDNTVRFPAGFPYELSTEKSVGMAALFIAPRQASTPPNAADLALPACFGDALSIQGDPQQLALSSLAILSSLRRLTSEGCALASVQMVRGNFNRDVILASLLPLYAANPLALRAFIWSCNAHSAAPWWLDRKRAQTAIEEGVAKLLAC
jgi:hypothetical protein